MGLRGGGECILTEAHGKNSAKLYRDAIFRLATIRRTPNFLNDVPLSYRDMGIHHRRFHPVRQCRLLRLREFRDRCTESFRYSRPAHRLCRGQVLSFSATHICHLNFGGQNPQAPHAARARRCSPAECGPPEPASSSRLERPRAVTPLASPWPGIRPGIKERSWMRAMEAFPSGKLKMYGSSFLFFPFGVTAQIHSAALRDIRCHSLLPDW